MRRRCETGSSLASAIFINRRRRPSGGASRPRNVDGHSSRPNVDSDSRRARRRHIDIRSTRRSDNSSDATSTVPTNYKPDGDVKFRTIGKFVSRRENPRGSIPVRVSGVWREEVASARSIPTTDKGPKDRLQQRQSTDTNSSTNRSRYRSSTRRSRHRVVQAELSRKLRRL
jgi:hypothetical protein